MMVNRGIEVRCDICNAAATPAERPGPARTNAVNEGFVFDDDVYSEAYCARHVPARLQKKVKK